MMRRPPRFVQGFIDRHDKPRFYFRRPGFPRVPLPGLPWSPEFMAAYEAALAGQPAQIASASAKPGTIRALAMSYYNSVAFNGMKARRGGQEGPQVRRQACGDFAARECHRLDDSARQQAR
jgi:hypothetical protein